MIDGVGNLIAAASGPVPFPWQTSGAAELYAARQAVLHKSKGQLTLITDFKELYLGWQAGHPYGTHSSHQYAELWVAFWEAVLDVGADQIDIEWIPSHQSQRQAREAGIPMAHWHGNKGAWEFVGWGMLCHIGWGGV